MFINNGRLMIRILKKLKVRYIKKDWMPKTDAWTGKMDRYG